MNPVIRAAAKVIEIVRYGDAVETAIKYLASDFTVKATSRGDKEYVVTIGRPNYAERLFIKKAIAAGEPFPIKKIQLRYSHGKKK